MGVGRLTSPNAEQQAPFRVCQTNVTKHFHVPDPITSAKSENQGKSAVGFQLCQRACSKFTRCSCVQGKRADKSRWYLNVRLRQVHMTGRISAFGLPERDRGAHFIEVLTDDEKANYYYL
jgi:hypothetical protein